MNKCKHQGWWFEVKILFLKRKYLWCDKCCKPIPKKEVFKNADILHRRGDGYFYSYYPENCTTISTEGKAIK